jgi:hypothetical protein
MKRLMAVVASAMLVSMVGGSARGQAGTSEPGAGQCLCPCPGQGGSGAAVQPGVEEPAAPPQGPAGDGEGVGGTGTGAYGGEAPAQPGVGNEGGTFDPGIGGPGQESFDPGIDQEFDPGVPGEDDEGIGGEGGGMRSGDYGSGADLGEDVE